MKVTARKRWRKIALGFVLLVLLLGAYWLVPISGQVIVMPSDTSAALLWPQMRLDPPSSISGQTTKVSVTDVVPWTYVLLTVNGQSLRPPEPTRAGATWTWQWMLAASDIRNATLVLYRDCQTGCIERGRMVVGTGAQTAPTTSVPIKLGVVFASPARDWRGRSGWDVELGYARLAEQTYWGVDDLAWRVQQATNKGLRVLVRVDLAQGQALPPGKDNLALTEYLQYVQRLARDGRLRGVYGYIIGSGFNALDSNSLAKDRPVTPQWYARVFDGAGENLAHGDNVVQTIRAENPFVKVLVGPLRAWNTDQNAEPRDAIDVPWLNYMNALVAALDDGARVKMNAGIPLAAPDGFAINAPARLNAPELNGRPADEPRIDLQRSEWNGAQAGFRIYRDWLAIINAYPTTRGLPLFINSTNTFAPDEGIVPAQNYARGWLTSALDVVNQEPQVLALCWFIDEDRSGDSRWDYFSLTKRSGRMLDAAEEFDALLSR